MLKDARLKYFVWAVLFSILSYSSFGQNESDPNAAEGRRDIGVNDLYLSHCQPIGFEKGIGYE